MKALRLRVVCGMIVLTAILAGHRIGFAAAPQIRVAASADEIFIGDSIDYQVEIRNADSPPAPDLSEFKDQFEVVANGDQSRDQSSITIINGRMTKQSVLSHLYQFRLTPRKPGLLTIPPAKVTIDGKTFVSSELKLTVTAAEKQDLVIVEMTSSHERVYQTQPFTVTLRILVRPLPNHATLDPLAPLQQRPPHLQVNWVDTPSGLTAVDKSEWLQPLLAEDGIGFTLNDVATRSGSFFDGPRAAIFNLRKGRETRDDSTGAKVKYFVYELSRVFTPEKAANYSLGPALVKGTFVSGSDGREYQARRIVASAAAINVEVRDVPAPRPPTYCGMIGAYTLSASASPRELRVGDPLMLTLKLERGDQSGSLELVSAPNLSAIEELVSDFELIDKQPTGRVEGKSKVFSYGLRPKRIGVGIPEIRLSAFNPQSEEFTDVVAARIPLEVSEAQQLTTNELVGSLASTPSTEIKSRAEGIFQNVTDPKLLGDQRISLVNYGLAALGAWCAAGVLIGVISFVRRKNSDQTYVRKQNAKTAANRRLNLARSLAAEGKSNESLHSLRAAMIGMIADYTNRPSEGLTSTDVDALLSKSYVTNDDRMAFVQLLETLESAEYGGGPVVDPVEALANVVSLNRRIGTSLDRGMRDLE